MKGLYAFLFLVAAAIFTFQLWAAEPVCAKGQTTLHKGPSSKEAISWKVGKYMPFLKLSTKKGWAKLQDLEGVVHYARATELSSRTRCVVVKTNVAGLHREPSSKAPAADFKTVDRFTPFKRVSDQSEWIQVEDEAGHQAWIHESQVWKPVKVNSFSF